MSLLSREGNPAEILLSCSSSDRPDLTFHTQQTKHREDDYYPHVGDTDLMTDDYLNITEKSLRLLQTKLD